MTEQVIIDYLKSSADYDRGPFVKTTELPEEVQQFLSSFFEDVIYRFIETGKQDFCKRLTVPTGYRVFITSPADLSYVYYTETEVSNSLVPHPFLSFFGQEPGSFELTRTAQEGGFYRLSGAVDKKGNIDTITLQLRDSDDNFPIWSVATSVADLKAYVTDRGQYLAQVGTYPLQYLVKLLNGSLNVAKNQRARLDLKIQDIANQIELIDEKLA